MALELHTWRIVGVNGLILNNPAETLGAGGGGGGIAPAKKVYDDKEEARMRTYKNGKGEFVYLTAGFRAGILTAASGRKINKKAARMILAGSVFPAEDQFLILDDKGKPVKGYEIHKAPVVVNKNRVLRCRPMFVPWSCLLPLEIDRDFIENLDVITQILNISGRIVGIGELRPDTSGGKKGIGTNGRYAAELVK